MKKIIRLLLITSSCLINMANASYTAIYPVGFGSENTIKFTKYTLYTPLVSEWSNTGGVENCSWTPLQNTVAAGVTFTQTATDCDQKQVRTKQAREKDELSNSIRNVGSAITETQTIKVSSSRSVVGSKPKDEVCMFGGGKAYWLESAGTTKIIWYSDNVEVSFPSGPTTYTYNGYEYTRGTYSSIEGNPSVGYTAFYYACRS